MYNPIITGRGWGLIKKSTTGDHFPWGGSEEYDTPHSGMLADLGLLTLIHWEIRSSSSTDSSFPRFHRLP